MPDTSRKSLFGGDAPWSKQDWTTCDDRVRGGSSTSHISVKPSTVDHTGTQSYSSSAFFHGFLDITTLGGAGFASQRNTTNTLNWHLEQYDGLEFVIGKSDGKRYTFVLKDEMLPKRPDGREQSSLNWEFEFVVPSSGGEEGTKEGTVFRAKWVDFMPTYRGRPKQGLSRRVAPNNIKRITLMMRSFFGTQSGDFEVEIKSIVAFRERERIEGEEMAEKPREEQPLPQPPVVPKEAEEPKRPHRPKNRILRLLSSCCRG